MSDRIIKARTPEDITAVRTLVWEFFDFLRLRYPEMCEEIDAYIKESKVAEYLENFADYFLPPNGDCFLAYNNGEPAGIVMLKRNDEREGEMNRMYVRDTARGLGLGRKLGAALVKEARALNYTTIRLDALNRHVEALPLYESLGFVRYTDPDAFGGVDERFIRMRKTL